MAAPAAPWMTRPATTSPPVDARAIRAQEATNRARPPTNTRRRPKTSPIAPEVTIVAAPTSRYPVTAHCSRSSEASRSAPIEGSRMLTAEVLAFTTKVDRQLVPSTPPVPSAAVVLLAFIAGSPGRVRAVLHPPDGGDAREQGAARSDRHAGTSSDSVVARAPAPTAYPASLGTATPVGVTCAG